MRESINAWVRQVGSIILSKDHEIRVCLAGILAEGHLLIEDRPGMGKTTLALALAKTLGLPFSRIQFTADLLPADVIGASIWDQTRSQFQFHRGPLFAQLVLGDELNRASPRTQSAFLEAMEEAQVTVDGVTYELARPFVFIATQNPREQNGTFPLPESQLDRFMMSLELGHPDSTTEKQLLMGDDPRAKIPHLQPLTGNSGLRGLQGAVKAVRVSEPVAVYVQSILHANRGTSVVELSMRAGQMLVRAAKAWAFMDSRDFVTPDDVKTIAPAVLAHRLGGERGYRYGRIRAAEVLASVEVPL
jgi:MoxR-like ATPase